MNVYLCCPGSMWLVHMQLQGFAIRGPPRGKLCPERCIETAHLPHLHFSTTRAIISVSETFERGFLLGRPNAVAPHTAAAFQRPGATTWQLTTRNVHEFAQNFVCNYHCFCDCGSMRGAISMIFRFDPPHVHHGHAHIDYLGI